jgi:hypothetical protein
VKKGGSLLFLIGTIRNVLVMKIGWIDVGKTIKGDNYKTDEKMFKMN